MPDMDSTQISMTLTLPKDTPLAETAEVTDRVVEKLMEMDEVVDVGAMASTSNMGMLTGGGNSSTNVTSLYISLREDKERDNLEIARDIEINISDILETAQAEVSSKSFAFFTYTSYSSISVSSVVALVASASFACIC